MGKGKVSRKTKARAGGKKPAATATHTASQLYAMAQTSLEAMEMDTAVRALEMCVGLFATAEIASLIALAPLRRAIKQEPDHVDSLHLLGELYAENMEYEKAEAVRGHRMCTRTNAARAPCLHTRARRPCSKCCVWCQRSPLHSCTSPSWRAEQIAQRCMSVRLPA